MTETLYDVLEVPEDASQREIRRAYRRKVKESHPDVSDHPNATARFRKIRRAHEVLTDPDERDRYDDLGHDAYMEWFSEDGSSGSRPGSGGTAGAGGGSSARSADESRDATGDAAGSASTGDRSGASVSGPSSGSGSASTSSDGTRGSSAGDSASSQSTGSSTGDPGATGDTGAAGSTGSSGAGGQASGGTDAGGPDAATANASTGPGPSGAGAGAASTRMGDAVDTEAVAEEAGRWRKKWQAAARGGGGESGDWSSGRAPDEDLEPERVAPGIATKIRSRDAALLTTVLLVAYPIFVYSSVAPGFPLVVNGVVGLATVFVVVYALTEPTVSLVVFGVWSILTPLLLGFLGVPLGAPAGLLAIAAAWVPFILAALLTLAMPD